MIIEKNDFLKQFQEDQTGVLIIACSYFSEIFDMIDGMKELNNKECIILPITFLRMKESASFLSVSGSNKIPKIIHYCWFGGNELDAQSKKCIESWKKMCPDYQIIEWNEENYDIQSSPWVQFAYEHKNWAYVSDYVRADVLYKYGGLYFDTDVEMIRNMDELLKFSAFAGFEKWPVVNTGGGCGSEPGFWLWKEVMKLKNNFVLQQNDFILPLSSGYFDTYPLIQRGLKTNGELQDIDGCMVLPSEYFHPLDYIRKQIYKTQNTFSIHYFGWSWANKEMVNGNRESVKYYNQICKRLQKI